MLGGYQIINLSSMSVSMGNDVSITDLNVLEQLLTLREHIEENYNYTIPLNKRLKAVMIRLRNAESGEKTEGCLWGNLAIIDDNLSFNIDTVVSVDPLKVLQINVVFEKKQDDDGNDYYDIKTAKYTYKGGQDSVIVTDIKNIPSATIKKLECGDIVLKKDSSGYHAYIVSFRNATGICLTYTDASCIETQSYDKVGQNWVYNSEDKSGNLIENVKPIYCHPIYCSFVRTTDNEVITFTCLIFNNDPTPFTSESFMNWAIALFTAIPTASIMASGYKGIYPCSRLKVHPSQPTESIALETANPSNTSINNYYTIDKIQIDTGTFVDGVNKIN